MVIGFIKCHVFITFSITNRMDHVLRNILDSDCSEIFFYYIFFFSKLKYNTSRFQLIFTEYVGAYMKQIFNKLVYLNPETSLFVQMLRHSADATFPVFSTSLPPHILLVFFALLVPSKRIIPDLPFFPR